MDIVIKRMESDSEIRGKAYVHWKSWQDAYSGLIDRTYLDNLTIGKCTEMAFRWSDNILIAKEKDRVIGYVGHGVCKDLPETGEVFAIYILKEYYDKKVGYGLMCAALEKLSEYNRIAVWVLESNQRAIRFYERCGFRFDGTRKQIMLGTANTAIRMILSR